MRELHLKRQRMSEINTLRKTKLLKKGMNGSAKRDIHTNFRVGLDSRGMHTPQAHSGRTMVRRLSHVILGSVPRLAAAGPMP